MRFTSRPLRAAEPTGATNIEAVYEILREKLPEDRRANITPEFVEGVMRGEIRTGRAFGINHPFHIYGE